MSAEAALGPCGIGPYHPSDFVAFGPLDVIEGMSRDAGEAGDGWDRDGSGGGWSGSRRAAAGAEPEAARRAGLADRHRLGRARCQPHGTRRRPAPRRRAAGHALPGDQPAARHPLIDTDAVMAPFAREVLARAGAQACTSVLIIDQSQVNATHQRYAWKLVTA